MIPRLKNYIWEQLAEDRLMAGIICDGFHLPKSVVRVFARAKGLDRLILVSDAAYLGGLKPGLYQWNDVEVRVFDDGHLGLPGTEALAGAAHLLDWDIPRFMEFTGYGLGETIPFMHSESGSYPERSGQLWKAGAWCSGKSCHVRL